MVLVKKVLREREGGVNADSAYIFLSPCHNILSVWIHITSYLPTAMVKERWPNCWPELQHSHILLKRLFLIEILNFTNGIIFTYQSKCFFTWHTQWNSNQILLLNEGNSHQIPFSREGEMSDDIFLFSFYIINTAHYISVNKRSQTDIPGKTRSTLCTQNFNSILSCSSLPVNCTVKTFSLVIELASGGKKKKKEIY